MFYWGSCQCQTLMSCLKFLLFLHYVFVLFYIQFDANKMLMMMNARVWQRAACRTSGMQFNLVTTYQQASL